MESVYLNNICRTCNGISLDVHRHMQSVFRRCKSLPHESTPVNEMIMACASVQVIYGDGLPSQICQVCVEQLKGAFFFKRQCENVDGILRKSIKNQGNKIKEEATEDCSEPQMAFVEVDEDIPKKATESSNIYEEASASIAIVNENYCSIKETVTTDPLCMEIKNEVKEEVEMDVTYDPIKEDENNDEVPDFVNEDDGNDSTFDSFHSTHKSSDPSVVKIPFAGIFRVTEDGLYPCPACNGVYDSITKHDKHVNQNHRGLHPHKCPICHIVFKWGNNLKRHIKCHSAFKPFECTICKKSFKRQDHLKEHQMLHKKRNDDAYETKDDEEVREFPCLDCQETLSAIDDLEKHVKQNHDVKVHKCSLCGGEFKRAYLLKRHVMTHSSVKSCSEDFSRQDNVKKLHENGNDCDDDDQKPFSQPDCRETHKAARNGLSEKVPDDHDQGIDSISEQSKKFLCTECRRSFSNKVQFEVHMRWHRGEKRFKCKSCGEGFSRTADLKFHHQVHAGEKDHLCAICGESFVTSSCYMVHMRHHTGEKPYRCNDCEAAFVEDKELKQHIRKKHKDGKYECEICMQSFLKASMLTQHKRNLHGLMFYTTTSRKD